MVAIPPAEKENTDDEDCWKIEPGTFGGGLSGILESKGMFHPIPDGPMTMGTRVPDMDVDTKVGVTSDIKSV